MKSPVFLAGVVYAGGVQIISNSLHLRFWTGFGIWLTGLSLAAIITLWGEE